MTNKGSTGRYRMVSNKKPTSKRRYRSRRSRRRQQIICRLGILLLIVLMVVLITKSCIKRLTEYYENTGADIDASKPEIDVQLLDVNDYSRPGFETGRINGIVIHYTANPGSSAQNNRDYFQNLQHTKERTVSSHFVIGIEGEIIQCVPTWEVAYASNERNSDTVSIECCHVDETGKFTEDTYNSLVHLTAWLCKKFDLDEEDVIRHYDVTGKNCPKYYVENEEAWVQLKEDVRQALEKE